MRGRGLATFVLIVLFTGAGPPAQAQPDSTSFVNPDSLFEESPRTPIYYVTSYDRNVSSGTWNQSLNYNLSKPRVAFSATANYASVDLAHSEGLGGESGAFGGSLNLLAAKNWTFGVSGTFGHVGSGDIVSRTTQRQNRLKVNSQYRVKPLTTLNLLGSLSTEFQQDHGLTIRPLGQERLRLLTRYNAAGDSVGVDSIFVHDQRDSTFMSGRQDGFSGQADWAPRTWILWTSSASGTRVSQRSTTYLRDFARTIAGDQIEVTEPLSFRSPNDNEAYQSKVTYTGTRGLVASVNLRDLRNGQGYYDKSLRKEEQLKVRQRGGLAHAEYLPMRGGILTLDGKLESILSTYALRTSRTSYVYSRSVSSSFSYNPSIRARASASFSLDNRKNERQESGNGKTISRFLQVGGGYRVSPRLGLDAFGSISLFSSHYQQAVLDQDNLRGYVNVGGVYVVSERCSTFVHFSATRTHTVAIDPSRSGNNNVQTTYQMDAALKLGLSPRFYVYQFYLLNAVYQIYDDERADSKNVLSRIKRIDTTIIDSLFSFASIQVVHNFLFRDSGSFTRPSSGGGRLYQVGSETYQQSFGATLNVRPGPGVLVFVTQSLGNSKVRFPASGLRNIDNRWNLAVGATVDRSLPGNASIQGTAQHIGAHSERRKPGDPVYEQDDWLAGVTFQKSF